MLYHRNFVDRMRELYSAGMVSVAHTSAVTILSSGQPKCWIAPRQARLSLP